MKRIHNHYITFILFFIQLPMFNSAFSQFDIQGHRGCRGLMPENTIPAFIKAVELGVTTLELDVVITSDNQILVSHDPYMSHEICLSPEGKIIPADEEKNHNIFQMTAAKAQAYDCGSLPHQRFPQQQKMNINKPLLSELIDAVENYIIQNNLPPVAYNIETKSTKKGDGIFHPSPEIFTDLLLNVVIEKKIQQRTMIQSFDIRTLQHLHKIQAPVKLVLLIENVKGPKYNLNQLGFKPEVYSPYFKLLSSKQIKSLHSDGIKVIPWTVNEEKDMKQLIDMGVDGIITDYPDRLISVVKALPQ